MRQSSLALEIALLGFLQQEPKHGYAIHQELTDAASLGQVWQIKLGHLYALLGKLEDVGYITATTEPQENKPPRKIFHLTEAGREAFLAWVQAPVQHGRSLRLEFLVKLYFARLEGTAAAEQLLTQQRTLCHEWLATEREMAEVEVVNDRRYGRLVHQFRSGQIQAMLNWLDLCAEA